MTVALRNLTAGQQRSDTTRIGSGAQTASDESKKLFEATSRMMLSRYAPPGDHIARQASAGIANKMNSLKEALYDSSAYAKIKTNQVVMHFGADWQREFFAQIDDLMGFEWWDPEDEPVQSGSFDTLLRLLLQLRGKERPGLGIGNDGKIIAAWTNGDHRLTVECFPEDKCRFLISQTVDGMHESVVGQTAVTTLLSKLSPYNPSQWFDQ